MISRYMWYCANTIILYLIHQDEDSFTACHIDLAPSCASSELKLVHMNGSAIQVYKKTLCYQERYDVQCGRDWFAPIRNTFSLKDPAFSSANNCTGINTYPKVCCDVNPTDCNFTSIKDFDKIRDVCSGKTYCTGQRAPWHPVYAYKPNMNCPYQQGLTTVLTTQYVTTEYMCVPYPSIQRMCEKGTKNGKGLFLASKHYPDYYPESTGFNCSCKLMFAANKVLQVAVIDLRLCSGSGGCGRSLNIGDTKVISVTNTKEEYSDIGGIVGLKEIYSGASATGDVTLKLTDVDSKDALYLWLYLYAEGDNQAAHDIKAIEKGSLLFEGDRVLACSVHVRASTDVYLSGIVSASMKNKVTYNYKLKVEKTGEPVNPHCECPAGKGPHSTCNHIAAVLLMLEHFISTGSVQVGKSCTENLQLFHKPKIRTKADVQAAAEDRHYLKHG